MGINHMDFFDILWLSSTKLKICLQKNKKNDTIKSPLSNISLRGDNITTS